MLSETEALPGRSEGITRRAALLRVASLMGGALSAGTLSAVLAGCDREGGRGGAALSAEQKEMVATIAEHIIPRTDTPGARDVGVADFIDEMMAEFYPENERALFLAGLEEVNRRARAAHGETFLDSTPEQQREVLTALDRETFAARPEPSRPAVTRDIRDVTEPGAGETPLPPEIESDSVRWIWGEEKKAGATEIPFFRTMKELTLVGYYTSEPGATQELKYAAVPGRYEGCVPFSRIGRTWAV